jgi:hypothetical protein
MSDIDLSPLGELLGKIIVYYAVAVFGVLFIVGFLGVFVFVSLFIFYKKN